MNFGFISARRTQALACTIAAGSLLTMALPSPDARAAGAFAALNGSWSGSGNASFAGGETEKLRCTARYSGGGSNLAINLKCASASAQINLSGSLDANGSKVSGDWSESSYGLSGDARGSASDSSVKLKISGGTNGYLTLSVSGNRHTVALSSQGTALTGVNVTLGRR